MKSMYLGSVIFWFGIGVMWGERGDSVFCASFGVLAGMNLGLWLKEDRI